MIITIDGPAASGKSTIARAVAKELGFFYINSGLLFRGIAYILVNKYVYTLEKLFFPDPLDLQEIFVENRLKYLFDDQFHEQLFFDLQDITPWLKTTIIDKAASIVSTSIIVRDQVYSMQRRLAQSFDIVVDGRDAGSIIFSEAQVKFFLTASLEIRAARWQKEQESKGNAQTAEQARHAVHERDERDSMRSVAPLTIPIDGVLIDNSLLTQQQTLNIVLNRIAESLSIP